MENSPNVKHDGGKLPILEGFLERFPRAVEAVAGISAFGRLKYGTFDGWAAVENAFVRYRSAMHRHELARLREEEYDLESRLLHLAHHAWGSMATLELYLRDHPDSRINPDYAEKGIKDAR